MPRILRVELTPEQEKRRRISVAQAAEIKNISEDSFRRHYAHLIEKTTPRRDTVQLGAVLED
jgi:mRNA-degrading endonuclease toxin of MazEF toxin-antitoxin module